MFSRHVSIHLKSNTLSDYTRIFDKDVFPSLRKQKDFKDEITFATPGRIAALCFRIIVCVPEITIGTIGAPVSITSNFAAFRVVE